MAPPRTDPAFAALLADPRMALRPPPPALGMERYRAAANAFMAQAPIPVEGSCEQRTITSADGAIHIQIDRPDSVGPHDPALFIHGGGFVFGGLASHASIARGLALASGMAVITLDYRLAPEHPAPAALDDCLTVLREVGQRRSALGLTGAAFAILGDSAGGFLALSAALHLTRQGEPLRALGLLYPMLDPTLSTASITDLGEGHMLTREFLAWAWNNVTAGRLSEPGFVEEELATLPTTVVALAECDPLHDEGRALAERLRLLGVNVKLRTEPGMIHGFVGLPQLTPAANQCLTWFAQQIAGTALSQP